MWAGPGAFNFTDDTTEAATWLHEVGLWDPGMTPEECSLRYKRFGGIQLGVIPREEWRNFLRDLLPFEEQFWYG